MSESNTGSLDAEEIVLDHRAATDVRIALGRRHVPLVDRSIAVDVQGGEEPVDGKKGLQR